MKKIKLGVIGMGRLGSIRAHDIATKIGGAELTALCSRVGELFHPVVESLYIWTVSDKIKM